MKILMFGWEFPPHISGGLGTASYGLTKGLAVQGDMDITFCIPKPFGDEDKSFLKIVGMNSVPITWKDVDWNYVSNRMGAIINPDDYFRYRDHIYSDFSYMHTNDLGCMEFAGGYPDNLHDEINNYSIIAGVVARTEEFDIIHSHDWLTYPAGIHAKQVSGKKLVIQKSEMAPSPGSEYIMQFSTKDMVGKVVARTVFYVHDADINPDGEREEVDEQVICFVVTNPCPMFLACPRCSSEGHDIHFERTEEQDIAANYMRLCVTDIIVPESGGEPYPIYRPLVTYNDEYLYVHRDMVNTEHE